MDDVVRFGAIMPKTNTPWFNKLGATPAPSSKPPYIIYKDETKKATPIADGWFYIDLHDGRRLSASWIATKANDGYYVVSRLPYYLFKKQGK